VDVEKTRAVVATVATSAKGPMGKEEESKAATGRSQVSTPDTLHIGEALVRTSPAKRGGQRGKEKTGEEKYELLTFFGCSTCNVQKNSGTS